jgi:hypothetical protein
MTMRARSAVLPALAAAMLLGGCAVYPDGSLGPLPAAPPPGVTVPPPAPPVVYAPPSYGYAASPGVPVQVVPVAPPVVVSPSVSLGIGWGVGYWAPWGYWGRPHRRW